MKSAAPALAMLGAAVPAFAQNLSSEQLNRRNIERRAVEAVIWGMPAVNYDLMLQEMMTKTAGKVNQVIIIEVPPAGPDESLNANIVNVWHAQTDGPANPQKSRVKSRSGAGLTPAICSLFVL